MSKSVILFTLVALIVGIATPARASSLAVHLAFLCARQDPGAEKEDQVDRWLKDLEQLLRKQDWKAAEELARKVVEATKGEESPRRIRALEALAESQVGLGRQADALPTLQDCLAIARRLFKGDHPSVAGSLNNVAFGLKVLGRSDEGLPLYQESLAMWRRLFEGDHPEVANTLNNVASCLDSLGRPSEALPLFQESLAMRRRLFEGDHPAVATSLNNVAFSHFNLGRPSEALPLFQKSLAMRRRVFKGDHPHVAGSLSNVAFCLDALGRSDEALPLYQESLAMRRRLFEGDHPEVANSLNNIAGNLDKHGRSAEALPLFQESLEMRRRLFKGDHPALAESLNNVASCLDSLRRSTEALPLFHESLLMARRMFKVDHPEVATSLNNVAFSHFKLGRPSEALPLYQESLAMRRRLFEGDHPEVANSLNNIAICLVNLGRPGEALLLSQESLAMQRRLFKGDNVAIATSLDNVAGCLDNLGRPGEALPLFRESLEMRRRLFKGYPPDVVSSLNNVAACNHVLGRLGEARRLRGEWLTAITSFVQRSSLACEARVDKRAEEYAMDIARLPRSAFESAYGLVGEARFFLREAASLSRAIATMDEDILLRDLRYAMLESRLAAERVAFGVGDVSEARRKADAAYVRYFQALEKKHGDRLRLKAPSLSDISKALDKNAVAVDIYRRTDRDSPYYLAVVLADGEPRFVELASEAQIETALKGLAASFGEGRKGLGSATHLEALDKMTLGKLEPHLKGKTRLYLAVDGVLAQVPFPALVSGTVPDSSKTAGRRYRHRVEDLQISLLPSVLELAAKSFGSGAEGAVLVGDVDYEAVAARNTPEGVKNIRIIAPPSGTRGTLPANGKWKPLDASRREVEALRKLAPFSQAVVLSGAKANEPNLLEKVRSPRYLHFSTHGFFVPKQVPEGKGARLDQISAADDPMYRSALVLAGANAREPGPPPEDGYLMASEAARLNLNGTRLVTLAACESGLGDSSVGQGILGLRRAFRSAGAQGVVMSLYAVPDSPTADLMGRLYENLSKGMTAPAALRQAQRSMLREGKGVFHWGLFVYEGFEK